MNKYLEKTAQCCHIFNSISCCVCFLITGTASVVFCLGIYFIIFSISYQLAYDSTEREKRFESIQTELSHDLFEFSDSCLRLEGTLRQFAEWTFGDLNSTGAMSVDRIISIYFPYIEIIREELGEDLMFGVWTHQAHSELHGDKEQQTAFFFDYGRYIFTNYTHSLELVIEGKDSYGHDLDYTDWRVEKVMEPLYTESDHAYYLTKHKTYEYWLSGEMPFMSFSIGSGPFTDFIGDYEDGHYYAGNVWFGQTIQSFSEKLKEITPKGTSSWLIEINLDYLLGVSDFEEGEGLFSQETFISPSEYDKNDVIKKLSDELQSNPGMLEDIREGSVDSHTSDGTHYLIHYMKYESYDGRSEWLLINSKSSWKIHQLSYLTITMSILGSAVLFVIFLLWVCFGLRIICEVVINIRQMKKIDGMDLDEIKFPFGMYCSFMEFVFLQKRFIKTVSNLKTYRKFLPEYLFLENEKEDKGFYFRLRDDVEEEEGEGEENDDLIFDDLIFDEKLEEEEEEEGEEEEEDDKNVESDSSSEDASQEEVKMISKKMKLQINENNMTVVRIVFREIDRKLLRMLYQSILSAKRKGVFFDIGFDSAMIIILEYTEEKLFLALRIVRSIKNSLHTNGVKLRQFPLFYISRGKGFYGNLGNQKIRKFCVGGPVVEQLRMMGSSDVIKKILGSGRSVLGELTDKSCVDVFEREYEVRMIDHLYDDDHVYEVGIRVNNKKKKSKKEVEKWKVYNEALEKYVRHDEKVKIDTDESEGEEEEEEQDGETDQEEMSDRL